MTKHYNFTFQENQFYGSCKPCTEQEFNNIVDSDVVKWKIDTRQQVEQAIEEGKPLDQWTALLQFKEFCKRRESEKHGDLFAQLTTEKKLLQWVQSLKESLPCFIFGASEFEEVTYTDKYGRERTGRRRKLQGIKWLSGLFMWDGDHLPLDPQSVYERTLRPDFPWKVVLAHKTSSGHGLRLVCEVRPELGNIADNQIEISRELGLLGVVGTTGKPVTDDSCIDPTRISYAPRREDIYYIDESELFNKENLNGMEQTNVQIFNEEYLAEYQKGEGHCNPTNPNHSFDTAETGVKCLTTPAQNKMLEKNEVKAMAKSLSEDPMLVFGHPIVDIINTMFPDGVPVNSRHKTALKLANDLIILLDGNEKQVSDTLFSLQWVKDVVTERGAAEIENIVSAAKKRLLKQEAENFYYPQPSRAMKLAIEKVTGSKYAILVNKNSCQSTGNNSILFTLQRIGKELGKMTRDYPLLKLVCFRINSKFYPAAFFVGGGFATTLLTRCWYYFWPSPGKKCRLNSLVLLIGRMGGGKQIAVDFYRIMMKPIKDVDAVQIAALNNWNQERDQNGSTKNKSPRPKGMLRALPSETSTAALREAEANAHEEIDGEDWGLHVSIFDSELQNTISQMKKGYMDAFLTYWLKSFHNEPHGAYLKTSNAPVGETDVHFNAVYTGTEDALKKLNTESNFCNGLNSRFTVVPNADSNFEMMQVHAYDDEAKQRDADLLDWCQKLDSCKGEIPCEPISKALQDWTARRMADAKENQDLAEEDLIKRPCWHAINFVLPFIITRHWNQMVQDKDGRYMCGPNFMIDKTDVKLALLIANAQLAFQEHFFKSVGEKYYDNQAIEQASNICHQPKTRLAFMKLPNPFTSEDVDKAYGYEGKKGSICSRLKRLQDDGLAQKIRTGEDKGKYRKLA